MLTADDPRVQTFLRAWHEAGRSRFETDNPSLNYDAYYAKTAHERRKYLALDRGDGKSRSGVYLVDRLTGDVFTIKSYGVANRRVGTLDEMTARMLAGQEGR